MPGGKHSQDRFGRSEADEVGVLTPRPRRTSLEKKPLETGHIPEVDETKINTLIIELQRIQRASWPESCLSRPTEAREGKK